MSENQKHVLVWVSEDFLKSPGIIRVLMESGLIEASLAEDRLTEAAQAAGGCAVTGLLLNIDHGAGLWMAPESSPGIELMIPWGFVRGVVTAEAPKTRQILGLARAANEGSAVRVNSPVKG